mmetsp:Transcript_21944/g.36748  ORF Transcript_21944/g.36748 Transcript_21944/m.36748 type:complete len:182 (-) Transcript_21944:54-599(-)
MLSSQLLFIFVSIVVCSAFRLNPLQSNSRSHTLNKPSVTDTPAPALTRKPLYDAAITEFGEEEDNTDDDTIVLKTHGYEGDFVVGDIVKVKDSIRIWSVKKYQENGFDAKGFVGRVHELALYGRKLKTLCSAITPVKVMFEPNGDGIPPDMFERKWMAHFAADELELVQKAPTAEETPSSK